MWMTKEYHSVSMLWKHLTSVAHGQHVYKKLLLVMPLALCLIAGVYISGLVEWIDGLDETSVYLRQMEIGPRHRVAWNDSTRVPTLLLWTDFFGDKQWGKKLGKYECPNTEGMPWISVIDDKSQLMNSDVVFFHCRDPIRFEQILVKYRQPEQIFAIVCHESPAHSDFRAFDKVGMNASVTYRLDSDFPLPYGKIVPTSNGRDMGVYTAEGPWGYKNRSIVWMVSNCHPPSKRDIYVNELSKYIDIDIFGACGMHKCSHENRTQCWKMFEGKYKFYLVLENSICRDYITEKFFTAMKYDIVPVVLGGADYSQHAPKHSYINVMDFKSPKILAEFLHRVGTNKTEYNRYFDWKKMYKVTSHSKYFCQLCDAARKGEFHKPAQDLNSWWKLNACDNGFIKKVNIILSLFSLF